VSLFYESIGGLGEVVALKTRQGERVVGIVDGAADERLRALANESRIGAEDQRDWLLSTRQKRFEFGSLERNH
jgi:hypothetical protein